MLYYSSGAAFTKLGVGTEGQVLVVSSGVPAWSATAPTASHNLLSAPHSDTTPGVVLRGDLITGQGATSKWSRLALGTNGQLLRSNGTDILWSDLTKSDLGLESVENTALSTWLGTANITTLGTITSGTWNGTEIADAKIATALTGKTYNGLTITTTTGTLTVGNLKTLTVNNILAFSGTDNTTMTFPATSATIARTDAGQTFTGTQIFSSTITGSISGNAETVTNGVYANAANSMTLINPLTTIVESWIGPSSTAGIYFKGGNVGIGTTGPANFKLEVAGDIGPEGDNTRNLGSPTKYFNTAYIKNLVTGTSGTVGYWLRTGNILSPVTNGDTVAIYAGAANTSGTLLNVAYSDHVTLSGALTGAKIDLNDGYVVPTNQSITGLRVVLPTTTNTNLSGTAVTMDGMSLGFGNGSGINQDGTGTTIYSGANLLMPALTQTSGTLIANGVLVTTSSSITTGGTANGLNISATGVGAGSLSGMKISNIIGSGGVETALNIGSGWDNILSVNGNQVIDGTGVVNVTAGGTGITTYTAGDILYASSASAFTKLAGGISNNNKVLVISGGLPTWGVLSGSSCTDCVLNDPTSVTTQTITPNNQDISSLVVRQTTFGSPTHDIFAVTSADGGTRYFYVDQNGNVSTGGVSSQSITLTPTSDTTALTLVGTNVPTANLEYINARNTQGSIFNLAYGGAATLAGALTGAKIDLATNVTATDQSVTGLNITLPAATNTTSTSNYRGLVISALGGAGINQTGSGTTIFSGMDITIPSLTQTAGSLTGNGILITTPSSITTGGTANGLNISATGIGSGTLRGVNVGNITAGAGVETALHVGTGWDYAAIFEGGNVGIGTTSPDTNLHIAGQIKITGGTPGLSKVLTSDANGLATWTTIGSGSISDSYLFNTGDTGIGAYAFHGGIFSLNDSSNYDTNINTGTSTGTVTIGGSVAQVINIGTGAGANTIALGGGAGTLAINTGDWDISTVGALTGISGITTDGGYTQSGTDANTFTGTSTFSNATYSALFTGGNVGIGTTGPGAKLDVFAGTNIPDTSATLGSGIRLSAGSATKADSYLNFWASSTTSPLSYGAGRIHSGWDLSAGADWNESYIAFQTHATDSASWTDDMIIKGGNVGIGTTTPGYLLDVFGSAKVLSLNVNGAYNLATTAGTSGYVLTSDGIGGTSWIEASGGDSPWTVLGNDIYKNNSGNIGIGTTTPAELFSVGSASQFQVDASGNIVKIKNLTYNWPSALPEAGGYALTSDDSGNFSWALVGGGGMPAGAIGQTIYHNGSAWTTTSNLYNNGANIGIGTTSPAALLSVGTTSQFQVDLSGIATYPAGGANWPSIIFTGSGNGTGFWSSGSNTLNISTGSSERLRIDSSGNVGFSQSAPDEMLTLGGAGNAGGRIHIYSSDAPTVITDKLWSNSGHLYWGGTTAVDLTAGLNISGTTGQTLYYNGATWFATSNLYNNATNVGIGTTNPAALFSVGSESQFNIDSSGNTTHPAGNANWPSVIFTDAGTGFWSSGLNTLNVSTNSSERLRIDSSGNVGFSQSAPDEMLTLGGAGNAGGRIHMYSSSVPTVMTDKLWNSGGHLYWGGATVIDLTSSINIPGTTGQTLYYDGTTWVATSSLYNNATNVGIGTTSPGQLLAVGADAFQVDSSGNIVKINNIAYSWPDSQAGGGGYVLSNNGSGTLSWASASSINAFSQNGNSFSATAVFGTNDNYDLTFVTNGSEKMRITPSGNVGIGTNSPVSIFQTLGGHFTLGSLDNSTAAEIRFREGSDNGTEYIALKAPDAVTNSITFTLPLADGSVGQVLQTNGAGALSWTVNASSGGMANPMTTLGDLIYASDSSSPATPARLAIGGNGQCLVTSGGLPVWGACSGSSAAAGATTQIQYNNAGAFGANADFLWDNTNKTLSSLGTIAGAKISLALRNSNAGSSASNELRIGNDALANALSLLVNGSQYTSAANFAYIYNKQNAPLIFGTNNIERLRIDGAGNVGIGTTTPNVALEIVGANSTNGLLRLHNTGSAVGDSNGIDFYHSSGAGTIQAYIKDEILSGWPTKLHFGTANGAGGATTKMTIDNIGKVGIGTTSPLALLDVNGVGAVAFGAVATPSFTFRTDLNTGMWNSGGDTINFSTNGTEKLRIDSAGNIGIGTTGPGAKLDIQGGSLRVYNDSVTQSTIEFKRTSDNWWPGTIKTTYAGASSYGSNLQFDLHPSDGVLATAPVTRLYIQYSGNVGIGTTSPLALLDVNGVGAHGLGTASVPSFTFRTDLDTGMWSNGANILNFSTTGVERFRVDSTGNISIGTTTPLALLDVNGIGAHGLGAVATPSFAFRTDLNTGMWSSGADIINFSTNGAERFRVDSDGNVGIGTTAPYSPLQVAGTIKSAPTDQTGMLSFGAYTQSASQVGVFRGDGAVVTTGNFLNLGGYGGITFSASAANLGSQSEWMRITTAGSVGIGTTAPLALLDVNGIGAHGLGAVSTPSFAFRTDLNTGMWSSGADTVNFSTNGTERLRMDSSGNVGIGTTSPGSVLDIYRTSGSSISLSAASAGGQATGNINFRSPTQSQPIQAQISVVDDSNYSGNILFLTKAQSSVGALSEKMRITSLGNIGIGTTAPETSLHVEKNVSGGMGADLVLTNKAGATNAAVAIDFGVDNSTAADGAGNGQIKVLNINSVNNAADMLFSTWNGSAFGERMRIQNGGNIGIGTTAPLALLDVNGVGAVALGAVATPSFAFRTDLNTGMWSSGADTINFSTNGTERVRIDSTGNIGIGTTSALALLDVNGVGAVALGAVSTPSFAFRTDLNTGMWSSGADTINFSTNGTERFRVDNTGNIGVGTTNPDLRLTVSGDIRVGEKGVYTGVGANYGKGLVFSGANGLISGHSGDNSDPQWMARYNAGSNISELRLSMGDDSSGDSFRIGYCPGASDFNLACTWTPTATFTSEGNVGIGTTNPNATLVVTGGSSAIPAMVINPGGSDWSEGLRINPSSANSYNNILFTNTANSKTGAWGFGRNSSNQLYVTNNTYDINGVPMMVWTTTGNVGIGTTSPLALLDVNGVGAVALGAVATPSFAFRTDLNTGMWSSGADTINFSTNATERFRVDSGGNIGIGTTAPTGKLNIGETTGVVHGAAQGSLILDHENSGGASSIVFRSKTNRGSDYGFIQYQDAAMVGGTGEDAKLIIGTANDADDDLILQPSGNVGIGTMAPASILQTLGGHFTLGALNTSTAAEIRFREGSTNGTEYIALKAPNSVTTSITFTLPLTDGVAGQVLQTSGAGALSWANNAASGGMANPMTTLGDLMYASVSGSPATPARLAIGTNGQCLVISGGVPVWGACSGSSSAAGADTQIQYNNAGSFGANSDFIWNNTNKTLSALGTINAAKISLALRNLSAGVTASNELQIGNDSSVNALSLLVNSSQFTSAANFAYIYNKQNAPLIFGTNNGERFRIDSTGKVGIGTTAPLALLDVNGVGAVALGAVATPSFAFRTDLNTGMWSSGADTINFSTNATERLRMDSGGNVGIGTTNPVSKLHLSDAVASSNAPKITLTGAGGVSNQIGLDLSPYSGRTGGIASYIYSIDDSNASAHLTFGTAPTGTASVVVERMRITNSGNVGIGTTGASSKLTIYGTNAQSWGSGLELQREDGGKMAVNVVATAALFKTLTAGMDYQFRTSTDQTNVTFKESGNVGIGTTTPLALLDVNGVGAVALGAVATPSFAFRTDLNTGMWSSGADTINFSTNATERFRVDSGGNIGIGTVNPVAKLHISNSTSGLSPMLYSNNTLPQWPTTLQEISDNITSGAVIGLNLENSSQTINTYSPFITFSRKSNSGSYNPVFASIGALYTGAGADSNWSAGDLVFSTGSIANGAEVGPIERMRILGSGNVGIGTTGPAAKLDIYQTGGSSGTNTALLLEAGNVSNYFGNNQILLGYDRSGVSYAHAIKSRHSSTAAAGNGIDFYLWNYGTDAAGTVGTKQVMTLQGSGNVGIGTTAPLALLDVNGNGAFGLGAVATPSFAFRTDLNTGMWSSGVDTVNFSTAGAERVRIDSVGNVSIGTTAPLALLDINGIGAHGLGAVATPSFAFRTDLNTGMWSSGVDTVNFSTNGTERLRMDSGGNIGIGTTGPGAKLDVAGSIRGVSENSYFAFDAVSDRIGFVKKAGFVGKLAYGLGNSFAITQSSTATIIPGSTYTDRLVVDSTGNVGIGTISPVQMLDVQGRAIIGAGSYNPAGSLLAVGRTDTNYIGGWNGNIVLTGLDSSSISFHDSGSRVDSIRMAAGQFNIGENVGWGLANTRIYGNAYVDGNIGIGTTAPRTLLDIHTGTNLAGGDVPGTAVITAPNQAMYQGTLSLESNSAMAINQGGTLIFKGVYTGTTPAAFAGIGGFKENGTDNNHAGYLALYTRTHGGANGERLRIDSVGNVGIGTTNPGAKLTVMGAGGVADALVFSMREGNNPTYGWDYTLDDLVDGDLILNRVNGGVLSQTMTFQRNSGNVGIGTTVPNVRLDVLNGIANTGGDSLGTPTMTVTGPNIVFGAASNNAGVLNIETNDAVGADIGGSIGFGGRYSTTSQAQWALIKGAKESATSGEIASYLAFGTRTNGAAITEKMRINSNGNIGIGTTNPGVKLQINGGDQTGPTLGSAVGGFALTGSSNVYGMYVGVSTNGDTWLQSQRNDTNTAVYRLLLNPNGGNVGVGTMAPSAKLDISPTVTTTTDVKGILSGLVYNGLTAMTNYYGHYVAAPTGTGTITNKYALVTEAAAGNVGIGTTGPRNALDVAGDITQTWTASSSRFIGMQYSDGTTYRLGMSTFDANRQVDIRALTADSSGFITFNTGTVSAPSEKMRITNGGNVGMGTTTPWGKLDVLGTTSFAAGSFSMSVGDNRAMAANVGGSILFRGYQDGSTIQNYAVIAAHKDNATSGDYGAGLAFYTRTAGSSSWTEKTGARMFIDSTGNVGIGTTAPGAYKLNIAGAGYLGAAAWAYSSDRRLKENIAYFENSTNNSLDKILRLKPAQYDYIIGEKNQLGFIAQDVQTVIPEAVVITNTATGMLGLKTDFIIPHLVRAAQEQQTQISGITDNQNKIVEQITGQLADRNLSVDSKLQLIGSSLDELTNKRIKSLKEQISDQAKDLAELKSQMEDIQTQNKEFNDFLLAFDVNSLDNFAKINAPVNIFAGQLESEGIVAGAFSVKVKDDKAATIGTSKIKPKEDDSDDTGKNVIIKTKAVSSDSKIYITPIGSTKNQVLYVGEIKSGASFEVKVDSLVTEEIEFNWWIVEKK
jgi:hypothetical protein